MSIAGKPAQACRSAAHPAGNHRLLLGRLEHEADAVATDPRHPAEHPRPAMYKFKLLGESAELRQLDTGAASGQIDNTAIDQFGIIWEQNLAGPLNQTARLYPDPSPLLGHSKYNWCNNLKSN